ncbi:conserved hypothetical protein [Roseibium sp. TrichSKD4]|nr:conserved hypothetical protein [Roseibium sp. TrichSKD4]
MLKSWLIPLPLGVLAASLVAASVSGAGLKGIFGVIALVLGLRMLFDQPHWRLGSDIPGNPIRSFCVSVRYSRSDGERSGVIMSIFVNGHCEAHFGYEEGQQEAVLVG